MPDFIEQIVEGSVTLDGQAATRGRCDFKVVDDGSLGLVPNAPDSDFAPYGTEVALSRGFKLADDSEITEPLGVFRIDSAKVKDTGDELSIEVVGYDRSVKAIESRFEEPWNIPAGVKITDAILYTILVVTPDLEYNFADIATTAGAPLFGDAQGDRWQWVQDLATGLGCDLYYDANGVLQLQPTPIPSGDYVAEVSEGEGGVLLGIEKEWTRQLTYNRVIATGEPVDDTAPTRGVATDSNPFSPTYYNGPFGRVPKFYSSPMLYTDEMAASAAMKELFRSLGTTQSIGFDMIVDPRRKPGDVLRINRERAGITAEDHILDSITIPLVPENSASAKTRAIQVFG